MGIGYAMDRYDRCPAMMLGAIQDLLLYIVMVRWLEINANGWASVNYAPVMDVNNNPDNPVINDVLFGR
jgi:beta-glucosidase-like glycosyl hydrolase